MPVVRINDQNWARLKAWAIPLEDRLDDVISRVLDAADAHWANSVNDGDIKGKGVNDLTKRTSSRSGRLPQAMYRPEMLGVLAEMGGRGDADEVCRRVFNRMEQLFGAGDLETTSTGEPHWRNRIRWERAQMIREGLLRTGARHGVWELSESGRVQAPHVD